VHQKSLHENDAMAELADAVEMKEVDFGVQQSEELMLVELEDIVRQGQELDVMIGQYSVIDLRTLHFASHWH
jgi:hypothetical protein